MSLKSIVRFLEKNPVLNYAGLEKEAGIPSSTLTKIVAGQRKLKPEQYSDLVSVLQRYGYKETRDVTVFSIVNNKGGVGKTTTTCNLGKGIAMEGKKVLLLDMDPQGNLSEYLGCVDQEKQLVDALLKDNVGIQDVVVEVGENLFLAPSSLSLDAATIELQRQPITGFNRVREVLESVYEIYDYILIDCPPSLGILTGSSLVASDAVILTMQPEPFSVTGMRNIFNLLKECRNLNRDLTVEGVLFTMVQNNTVIHKKYIEGMRKALSQYRIFETQIRKNIAFPESAGNRQDIFTYDASCMGAKDYSNLAKEIINE